MKTPTGLAHSSSPASASLCMLATLHLPSTVLLFEYRGSAPLMPCHVLAAGGTPTAQAAAWRAYIGWERNNPQRLDGPALAARVSLAYEQALMPLYHHPEVGVYQFRSR